jgi:hypothetical protein
MPGKIIATHSVQFNFRTQKECPIRLLSFVRSCVTAELHQSSNSDISDSIANWLSVEIAFACLYSPPPTPRDKWFSLNYKRRLEDACDRVKRGGAGVARG